MIVRNITLTSCNYNKNQVPKRQIAFQGRLLSQARNVITYNCLARTTFTSAVSNLLLTLTETIPNVSIALSMLTCASAVAQVLYKGNKIQLDKHIEFKKAENVEEAKLYAKEKLGIRKFEIDDLEFANWINNGLTNVSNRFEGKVYFPKKIKFKNVNGAFASYKQGNNTMYINKEEILSTIGILEGLFMLLPSERFTKINYGKGYEEFYNNLNRAYKDFDSLTIFEKLALAQTIAQIKDVEIQLKKNKLDKTFINNNQFNFVYEDEFSVVYHEIGHCFDLNSKSTLTYLLEVLKFKSKLSKLKIPMYYKSNLNELMASAFDAYMRNESLWEENKAVIDECVKYKIPHKKQ